MLTNYDAHAKPKAVLERSNTRLLRAAHLLYVRIQSIL